MNKLLSDLFSLLSRPPALSVTMAYFGDAALTWRQTHKIVDEVYDTITIMSHDSADILTQKECVQRLLLQSLIQKAACNRLGKLPKRSSKAANSEEDEDKRTKSREPLTPAPGTVAKVEKTSSASLETSAIVSSSGVSYLRPTHIQAEQTPLKLLDNILSIYSSRSASMTSTDLSSILLTPVARLPIGRRANETGSSLEGESSGIEQDGSKATIRFLNGTLIESFSADVQSCSMASTDISSVVLTPLAPETFGRTHMTASLGSQ